MCYFSLVLRSRNCLISASVPLFPLFLLRHSSPMGRYGTVPMSRNIIKKCKQFTSVVDPDPHGSGTFSWILNYCYGSRSWIRTRNKTAIYNKKFFSFRFRHIQIFLKFR